MTYADVIGILVMYDIRVVLRFGIPTSSLCANHESLRSPPMERAVVASTYIDLIFEAVEVGTYTVQPT